MLYPAVVLVPKPAGKRPMPPPQQCDVASLVHPYTELAGFRDTGPTIIVRGKAFTFSITRGDYIEGMAGLWCTALGCGNRR
jgi:adenosylmethionine-8-amino-7-oxononanoate aminotransferase